MGRLSAQQIRIAGLQTAPSFRQTMFDGAGTLDVSAIEREVVATLDELGPVDAVLLECAALPPYARALQERLSGVPVFDITTATSLVTLALRR